MVVLSFRLIILIKFIIVFDKFVPKSLIKNLIYKSKSNIKYFIKPKISIILPIYNDEKYLNDFFNNLLTQTFKNLEIICLDYGSTDKSLFILKKYEKKDKRLLILSQNKENQREINNYGLNIAKGEYVLFLNIGIFFSK